MKFFYLIFAPYKF